MIEALLALVPTYGIYVVALSTFLSCLALPIPSSLIMLTAGAFVATGDLHGPTVAGMALAGAVIGDQVGYVIGRAGSGRLDRLKGKPATMVYKARRLVDSHGVWAVFLSRWLLSPLGPYMNFVTGAARMNWLRFTVSDIAGEAVWTSMYLGLGYIFVDQIGAVADIASNFTGALAAGAVAVGLGLWLRAVLRADKRKKLRNSTAV